MSYVVQIFSEKKEKEANLIIKCLPPSEKDIAGGLALGFFLAAGHP